MLSQNSKEFSSIAIWNRALEISTLDSGMIQSEYFYWIQNEQKETILFSLPRVKIPEKNSCLNYNFHAP